MSPDIVDKARRIKFLIVDVDGILTSGQIVVDERGDEIKVFDVRDGFGIVLFKRLGYKTAILSARSTGAVTARGKDLRVDRICQNASPKTTAYEEMIADFGFIDDEVCFMGDDLPDLCVLNRVGLAITVPNASPEVKAVVHHVTEQRGGQGAVREVVELILKAKGEWDDVVASFQ